MPSTQHVAKSMSSLALPQITALLGDAIVTAADEYIHIYSPSRVHAP